VAGEKLVLGTTTYTVARRTDGERAGAALAEAGLGLTLSYAEATSVIEKRAAGDPGERRRLRVVPAYAAVGADAA
jgi:hypothetical protein